MKKIMCLVLCLMMLAGSALAEEAVWFGDWMEVVKCNEFITLREEPSTKAYALDRVPLGAYVRSLGPHDERFHRVLYDGQAGYVLSEYLGRVQTTAVAYPEVVVYEGTKEAYNIDLFLTNFTEQYFCSPYGYFDVDTASDAELVQFAIEHIWFNRQDRLEWGEWGEGEDAYNVRLSDEFIVPACEKYFGRAPENLHPLYMDYFGGYYYWTETGGHVPGGFAQMYDIKRVGADQYKVAFCVYGQGCDWDNSVYGLGERELWRRHPEHFSKYQPRGCAVFTAEDLLDRSSWKLESICMDWEV